MSDETIRYLAIAFAHAKLIQEQQQYPENAGWDTELRDFLKWYDYASARIPIEYIDMEEHF